MSRWYSLSVGIPFKADKQRVEILEYGSVLAKYTTMRLVYDDKVEVSHREPHRHGVDIVNHGLVGGEDEARRLVRNLVLRQTGHRLAWQMLLKVLACLFHQLVSVGKE